MRELLHGECGVVEDVVVVRRSGRLGRITLNRPDALNALTGEMVGAIDAALDDLETARQITTVLIDGAGSRGLCAGGDIRFLFDAVRSGDPGRGRIFFRDEYRLNARIARYPKPVVALMDGIVMGGGVGLSAHAAIRVVTERSKVAMPEVGIGFAPDVGGTWLLSRAPGQLGTHIALTGAPLNAADAILCGLADCYLPSAGLDALIERLAEVEAQAVVTDDSGRAGSPPPGVMSEAREWIDSLYAADSAEEIVARLQGSGHPGARAAAAAIAAKSPTSIKVALRALRHANSLPTLEACLDAEYRISSTFLETPDFAEGVRAAVVDKDRNPRWAPPNLEEVTAEVIDPFFARRDDELNLADQMTTGETTTR